MSPATLGIISGSGTYHFDALSDASRATVATPYGDVPVTEGSIGGTRVVHLSRHGDKHERLPNSVAYKANITALLEAGVTAAVSLTVCGAVDRNVPLGSLIAFDDLYFPANAFPDGTACTWYETPGDPRRGHWIADMPYSRPLRELLCRVGNDLSPAVIAGGCYGHVNGPRFNTKPEIRALAQVGVTAVSQTAGPEVVLAGEAELPIAVVGFTTDYANGVAAPEPIEALLGRMNASTAAFAALVEKVARALPNEPMDPAGFVYRFEQ